MKISLGLPTQRVDRAAEFVTAEAIAEMSRAAETAGFDAVYVTEHPIPQTQWMDSGGHHALDPFVALSFAAAATTTLRVQTHLCVLPYRNPFLTAKTVASLDALSGGRVILGVGTGYLQDEFEALGVDFAERNDLTDEAIVTMKAAGAVSRSAWPGATSVRTRTSRSQFRLSTPIRRSGSGGTPSGRSGGRWSWLTGGCRCPIRRRPLPDAARRPWRR
jgi:alkanesulfonate monooxygenase SsuD/methylene tetrahydromethanopterin reductase-like flavin-dependent oxidoreductase (luciferase family)